jgi:hypothetical protein
MTTPTPITTSRLRGQIYAAASACGRWEYVRVGAARWAVTHVPTLRRYWAIGLDQARQGTADGTAARRLETWRKTPPPGKPMVTGEHHAITHELCPWDCEQMLAELYTAAALLVEAAARRVRPNAAPDKPLSANAHSQILGVIYGHHPGLWLHALHKVRPDLIPPHLSLTRS